MIEENGETDTQLNSEAKNSPKDSQRLFLLFGFLQSLGIGTFIFLIFRALNTIHGSPVIGLDSQILLSVLIPIFIFNVEYYIYSKI